MTVKYIVKRIYMKQRLIADLELLAIKKLISGYKFFISIILICDLLFLLSITDISNKSIFDELSPKYILIINLPLVFFAYRIWKNTKNHKYDFPEPNKYVSDLKEYSIEDLRKLVTQVNSHYKSLENLVMRMAESQIMIPTFVITVSGLKALTLIVEFDKTKDFGLLFFVSAIMVSGFGFLIGFRSNVGSFVKTQNTIIYKIRNLIIDSLVFSPLNPGSNAIRKPNKRRHSQ